MTIQSSKLSSTRNFIKNIVIVTALLLLVGCSTPAKKDQAAPGEEALSFDRVDQIHFSQLLKINRPKLFANYCKPNLTIKPKYRQLLLDTSDSVYTIVKREYSDELKKLDKKWANSHRKKAAALKKNPEEGFSVANYNPMYSVGYKLGRQDRVKDGSGDEYKVGYKVYLQFDSILNTLSPDRYVQFNVALRQAGFEGDSKVQLRLGSTRYQYNNMVIHARTRNDAYIAERVGLKFFKEKLDSVGRGLDVLVDTSTVYDWNNFLCKFDLTNVPQQAIKFTQYMD